MSLHWDRFDNALSELWRFFGRPLLNFLVLLIIFSSFVSWTFESLSKLLADVSPHFAVFIVEFVPTDTEGRAELGLLALGSAGAAVIPALVFLAILIFLLDVLTLQIGGLIPVHFNLDEDRLVHREELADFFEPETESKNSKKAQWIIAKTKLDHSENLPEYRRRRDVLKTKISDTQVFRSYVKAYLAMILPSLFLITSETWVSSILYFAVLAGIFLSIIRYQRLRQFVLGVDLIKNDLEVHAALEGKLPVDMNLKSVALDEPYWQDCIPYSRSREYDFLKLALQRRKLTELPLARKLKD